MIRDLNPLEEKLSPKYFRIIKIYQGRLWSTLITMNERTGEEFVIRSLRNDFIEGNRSTEYVERYLLSHLLTMPGVVKCKGYRLPLTREQKKNRRIKKRLLYTNEAGRQKNFNISGPLFYTEYIPKGNIKNYTIEYLQTKGQKNKFMNPTIRSKIIFGISSIMKQVHKKKVIHRFLDISRIFLNENFEPKIDGFYFPIESICDIESEIQNDHFDMLFKAPEFFEGKFDFSCDVYSFGVILYFLFVGDFELKTKKMTTFLIYKKIFNGEFFKKNEMIPEVYWDLIKKCLEVDVKKRPTFDQITEILKDDKFALNEFGMKTNLEQLHEYQQRINIL